LEPSLIGIEVSEGLLAEYGIVIAENELLAYLRAREGRIATAPVRAVAW
jgi:hypothetical protein